MLQQLDPQSRLETQSDWLGFRCAVGGCRTDEVISTLARFSVGNLNRSVFFAALNEMLRCCTYFSFPLYTLGRGRMERLDNCMFVHWSTTGG